MDKMRNDFLRQLFPSVALSQIEALDPNDDLESVVDHLLASVCVSEEMEEDLELERSLESQKPSSVALSKELQLVEQLQSMFPNVVESSIERILEGVKWNPDLAALKLIDLAVETPAEMPRSKANSDIDTLTEMFPHMNMNQLITAYKSTGRDVGKTVDHFIAIQSDETNVWKKPSRSLTTSTSNISHVHTASKPPNSSMNLLQPSNASQSPAELRLKASELHSKRIEAYREAARQFRKGGLTGSSSAAYYADLGHSLASQVAHMNQEAAKAQLKHNSLIHDNNINVIDLHGLTVKEAVDAFERLALEWRVSHSHVKRRKLKIVTGAGNHSVNNQPRLLQAVQKRASKLGFTVSHGGNGWFYVSWTIDSHSTGSQ